jgi:hypothetical protein
LRAQAITDDALPARHIGFDQGTPVVARRSLPAHAAALMRIPVMVNAHSGDHEHLRHSG